MRQWRVGVLAFALPILVTGRSLDVLQWRSAAATGLIYERGSFRDQLDVLIGSLILTGLLAAAGARREDVGSVLTRRSGTAAHQASLAAHLRPNIIATALANNMIVTVLIAFGFILNAHQIVHNCYIGMTRVMVAMSFDRLLPELISRVSERLHTPVNAHVVYFLASIPVIWLYNNFAYGRDDRQHRPVA